MIILPSPANSQREFAPNSQYCEFQAEFAANSRCERIRSEFGEFKLNSLRICIPKSYSPPVLGLPHPPIQPLQQKTYVRGGESSSPWESTPTTLATAGLLRRLAGL